jgi:hypothetical protein
MGLEPESTRFQLRTQPFKVRRHEGILQPEVQVAEPEVEQFFIVKRYPGERVATPGIAQTQGLAAGVHHRRTTTASSLAATSSSTDRSGTRTTRSAGMAESE